MPPSSRDPGVFTRPGSSSIRPAALADAIYELALGGGGGGGTGGLTPAEVQALIDASILAHEAKANPHPVYLTQAEGDALYLPASYVPPPVPPEYVTDTELATALLPYATDLDLSTHAAAADPHPVYQTQAEVTTAISNHASAPDPHPVYLTQAEADALYPALAHNHDARYFTEAESDVRYATPATVTAAITAHESALDPHPTYLTQSEGDGRYLQSGTAGTTYVPLAGGSVMTGLLGPSTTNSRDLGTTTLRWRKLWGVDAEFTNVPTVGGVALPTTASMNTAIAGAVTAHEGLADPHPTYTTAAELSTAIANHAALADPHAVYATDADLTAHAGAADPHPTYLTAAEGNVAYLTPATAASTYLPLAGGTLTGDLIVSEATPLVSLKLTADTQPRARLTDLGLYFGPGGATALDTSLLRTAANALSLGGSPVLTQTLGDARYQPVGTYLTQTTGDARYLQLTGGAVSGALSVQAKAVALSPNANQTLQWLANGFFSDAPTKAQYDALVVRVAALEAQMGPGTNGHYHNMGTWRQTAKATLPATVLEEAVSA